MLCSSPVTGEKLQRKDMLVNQCTVGAFSICIRILLQRNSGCPRSPLQRNKLLHNYLATHARSADVNSGTTCVGVCQTLTCGGAPARALVLMCVCMLHIHLFDYCLFAFRFQVEHDQHIFVRIDYLQQSIQGRECAMSVVIFVERGIDKLSLGSKHILVVHLFIERRWRRGGTQSLVGGGRLADGNTHKRKKYCACSFVNGEKRPRIFAQNLDIQGRRPQISPLCTGFTLPQTKHKSSLPNFARRRTLDFLKGCIFTVKNTSAHTLVATPRLRLLLKVSCSIGYATKAVRTGLGIAARPYLIIIFNVGNCETAILFRTVAPLCI